MSNRTLLHCSPWGVNQNLYVPRSTVIAISQDKTVVEKVGTHSAISTILLSEYLRRICAFGGVIPAGVFGVDKTSMMDLMPAIVPFEEAWNGHADCRNCSLRDSVLFAGLQEQDFEFIHRPINQLVLQPGDRLYHAGTTGERLFTIRKGLVKLSQLLPDGSPRIVRLAQTTDVIGMESLLEQPHEHDAVAMWRTEVCCLPVSVVQTLSEHNAALHRELLNRWHKALKSADDWITLLSTGPAKERVARLLLRLVDSVGQDECDLFGREDLGAILGITTETASRTIADFKRRGLIAETGPNRFLLNIVSLRELADR